MLTKNKVVSQKPQADVIMECVACKGRFGFNKNTLIEQALSRPNLSVVEGLIVCPYCGNKIHCYYMSEHTRYLLGKVKITVMRWHTARTDSSYKDYEKAHRAYKNSYDRDQKKYGEPMKEKQADGKETANSNF